MEPYQERMIEERTQLAERIKKLQTFTESSLFKSLPSTVTNKLYRQENAMCLYLYILNERIAEWDSLSDLDRTPMRPLGTAKPIETATSSLILGNPARSADTASTAALETQVSLRIVEWSKETGRDYDKSNAGWDESEVCAFVAWLIETGRLVVPVGLPR